MPYGILSVVTATFIFFSLISYSEKIVFNKSNYIKFLGFTGFYFTLLISVFYSDDYGHGISILFRLLPLIIFPYLAIFHSYGLSKKVIENGKKCFLIGSFLLLAAIYFIAFQELKVVGFDKLFYWATLTRSVKSIEFLDLHPNYMALYFALSIYLLIDSKKLITVLKVGLIFVLGITIILLSARAAFISVIVSVILNLFLNSNLAKGGKVTLILIIIVFSFLLLRSNRYIQIGNSYKEMFKSEIISYQEEPTSNEIRVLIIKCFKKILRKDLFFGLGVGDLENRLDKCYVDSGNSFMLKKTFNTHNNYLYLLGSAGILGLLSFFHLLSASFWRALKFNNRVFLMFMVTISITLLFENILSRSYGITFFSYFMYIFYLETEKNE
tara:strand:- start:3425 stop:4573 length:1149 start_codon:yes stop_codon:yes gene_type:complete